MNVDDKNKMLVLEHNLCFYKERVNEYQIIISKIQEIICKYELSLSNLDENDDKRHAVNHNIYLYKERSFDYENIIFSLNKHIEILELEYNILTGNFSSLNYQK